MSLNLIFETSPTSIDGIEFDAGVLEVHTKSAEVTSHPVEDGSTVSDHVSLQPDRLTINGVFSNDPLLNQLVTKLLSSGLASIGPRRAENAYNQLVEVFLKRRPVTVSTSFEEYEDMVITGVNHSRDASTGGAIHVTVELQRVKRVSTQKVAAPTTTPAAVSKVSKGKKPTKKLAAPVASKSATQYQDTFSTIIGLFK